MNLQRREEIRALANYPSEWDGAKEYQDAIRELLAHIDALEQTAAERVIARGAVVKPHTFAEIVNQVRDIANQYAGTEQLRERIAYALTPHFERNGGMTPDYTGEGSAWVPSVEARAVVVPEPSMDDDEKILQGLPANYSPEDDGYIPLIHAVVAWAREHALAIPADRVLGEGMAAVDREDCALAVEWCHAVQDLNPGYLEAKDREACERLKALRANQGGAAT